MGSASMSSRWLPAMEAPILEIVSYAEIWTGVNGSLLAGNLEVTAGTVTVARGNVIRRTAANVTFAVSAASALMPITNGAGLLYPLGYELKLYKGCRYSDGTTEVAKLGTFLLEQSVVLDNNTGVTIAAGLKDRAQTISRAQFLQPYSTDGSSTTDVAIQALISGQVSGLAYSLTPSTVVPPVQSWTAGSNPWSAAQTLAVGAGMELFIDANGTVVLQPIVNPSTIVPCATYIEGTPAAPDQIQRTISNANVPNIVIAIASGTGISPPIMTYWWDNNPASPTFYASGTPGPVLPARDAASTYPTLAATINTSVATDLPSTQAIANAAGLGYLGTFEQTLIRIRDNPAHDVNDVVTTQRVIAGIVTPQNYIADTVVIDCGLANGLQLTGRLVTM